MFRTILIPDDGSESGALALHYADLLPSEGVRLVRVEPPFQVLAPGPLEDFRPDWRTVRAEQVQQELAPVVERFQNQGRVVDVDVRFGDPAEEIIAASEGADLIVMSTQGRGTAGRALFGSVADRVARHSHTPTLLVRAAAGQSVPPRLAGIVVPLDGSLLAEQALPMAVRLATDLDLPVHLLRVVESKDMNSATAYLRTIAEPLRAQGRTVQITVPTDVPVFALLDAIHPDDLVVMTSHGRSGMARWLLGSVAEQVLRSAQAPVLLVRAPSVATPASTVTGAQEPD
ncbi:MAG: universal stress protein [Thermomicrobiales bacterium]|nr:universal stress protein [Thermomicrobiales bacterium]